MNPAAVLLFTSSAVLSTLPAWDKQKAGRETGNGEILQKMLDEKRKFPVNHSSSLGPITSEATGIRSIERRKKKEKNKSLKHRCIDASFFCCLWKEWNPYSATKMHTWDLVHHLVRHLVL